MKNVARLVGTVTIMSLLIVSARPAFADPLGSYRWRADDGTEATATFPVAENTAISGLTRNTPERLRFAAGNSGTETELLEKASAVLIAGEKIGSGVIDAANGYAYLGTVGSPAKIVKIALGAGDAAPIRLGALTLEAGESNLYGSGVIDTVNGYAYFGTYLNPAKIIKVALGTGDALPTRIGSVSLAAGENAAVSAAIDTVNGYGYFSTETTPAKIVKIALGTGDAQPTRIGAITLNAGESGGYASLLIDQPNGYLYLGTYTSPAKVVKVAFGAGADLPARVDAATLDAAEKWIASGAIDTVHGYAYFGTDDWPAYVVKVKLGAGAAAPTRIGAAAFDVSESYVDSGVVDTVNGYAYFGTDDNPGRVVKIDLGSGDVAPTRVGSTTLGTGENSLRNVALLGANGYVYFSNYGSDPGHLAKISIAPKAQFRLEYGRKSTACSDIADWTQVPTTATSEAFQMASSSNLTDGGATTHNAGMTAANVSFQPGEVKTTSSQTSQISLGEKQYTELEYSVESTLFSVFGTTYCFRLTNAGTATAFSVDNYAEVTLAARTGTGGGGGGGTPAPATPSITVRTPAAGATFNADDEISLDWTPANGAFIKYKVSYSNDNGTTWAVLSDNATSTNTSWIVPDAGTTSGLIKVEGYDQSGALLATGTSGNFTVIGEAVPDEDNVVVPPPATDPTVAGTYTPNEAKENNPDFNTDMGLSSKGQEPNSNPPCVSNTLIKGTLPSVYYCGADGKRYVFVNDKAFFSWYPDFSMVQTISDADLALIPLGGNITYRPGSRMIKIQSDPKVYVVARGGILRWVSSEAVALRLFGANWNQMIDDVPDSFFVNYTIGVPITQ